MKSLIKNLPGPVACSIFGTGAALLALWSALLNQIFQTLAWAGIGIAWIVLAVISWKRKRKNTTEKVNS